MRKATMRKLKGSVGLLRSGEALYITLKDPGEAAEVASKANFYVLQPREGLKVALKPCTMHQKGARKLMAKDRGTKTFEIMKTKKTAWLWAILASEGFATVDVEITWFSDGLLWVDLPTLDVRKPVSEARVNARSDDRQMALKLVG